MPTLTEQNKADLTRCAEEILLARERHFPATIADMYDPERMAPSSRASVRPTSATTRCWNASTSAAAFRNDTERLERLFDLYTRMTAAQSRKPKAFRKRARTVAEDSP